MNSFTWFENTVNASINEGWMEGDVFGDKVHFKRLDAFSHLLAAWHKIERASDYTESPVDFSVLPRIVVFAPRLQDFGYVAMRQVPPGAAVVYLAPTLELNSQRDVNHTVAHEIAHVVLGHWGDALKSGVGVTYENRPVEIAANALAAKWGFPLRKRGKTGVVKMLEACWM
ncbi:MAG: ImmA/IrrE family metallo-endopeptidase [Candidatus Acidiferrales bacterium]